MMNSSFESYISRALRERAEGQADLAAALLNMSTDDLAECGPETWDRLGQRERARLIARLRLDESASETPTHRSNTSTIVSARRMNRLRKVAVEVIWLAGRVPIPIRGIMAGGASAIFCTIVGLLLYTTSPPSAEESSEASNICHRLIIPQRSCSYLVQGSTLTWADAAARIGVSEAALRAGNPNIPPGPLVGGTYIRIAPEMSPVR